MNTRPKLVPELCCTRLDTSLKFYQEMLGFRAMYSRPENRFVFMDLLGVELMLDEIPNGKTDPDQGWNSGKLEQPFGRGINLQFEVESVDTVYQKLIAAKWPIFLEIHDAWYRRDDMEVGLRQFLVLDPDGYQLRPFTPLGERNIA